MNILHQCELTGCRVVGAITELGKIGPKHHGIILGVSQFDGEVYVAEKLKEGNQLCTLKTFQERYQINGDVEIKKNDGNLSDLEVAQRALTEANERESTKYDLISNNCESFSNRAMYGHSVSHQVVNTILAGIVFIGGIYLLRKTK